MNVFIFVNLILLTRPLFAQYNPHEFKLALVQMYVEPGNLQKNLSNADKLIAGAASGGADFVLLPEVMDLGWTHPSASNVGPVTEGPWKNWRCIGCSLIIGPDGKEVLMGPYGEHAEKIMFYNIKPVPRPARGTGWYKELNK